MQNTLFKNITSVNEGKIVTTDVLTKNGVIDKISPIIATKEKVNEINGDGLHLFPGVIDDHVHFREPGLTQKSDIHSGTRAAVAGGVTSFMEMPNTIPNAVTIPVLEEKYALARKNSVANYSFYMGASNTNTDEILKLNALKNEVCGLKVFMGSSTGNMLVDNDKTLHTIFAESELLIATHCEDETMIRNNYAALKAKKGELEVADHPIIRNVEVCYKSSSHAVALAKEHHSRLHIMHLTTAKETGLFQSDIPLSEKRITCEVCVHHLHFTADDYARLGYLIKCNPAIKEKSNKAGLWQGLLENNIDVIGTDHAPHLLSEKRPPYEKAHSGLPLVQHALPLMLYYYKNGAITLEKLVEKMCHAPADCFKINNRGYLREGYFADLVVVDLNKNTTVTPGNIYYKCGWSPLDGFVMPASVEMTFVNGNCVFDRGAFFDDTRGMRIKFVR